MSLTFDLNGNKAAAQPHTLGPGSMNNESALSPPKAKCFNEDLWVFYSSTSPRSPSLSPQAGL